MGSFFRKKFAAQNNFTSCSGCSLCLLVCPIWRRTRDIALTPHGRAKALQHGVDPHDLRLSAHECILCGACEPACPEQINLVPLALSLRNGRLPDPKHASVSATKGRASSAWLLGDASYGADPELLQRIIALCGISPAMVAMDTGDILLNLTMQGGQPEGRQLANFRNQFTNASEIIVTHGLIYRMIREWLPEIQIKTLGETLLKRDEIRMAITEQDFYMIEARSYHADYQRLVGTYDDLRKERGCKMNLDLQRLAIPLETGKPFDPEQALWSLQGFKGGRIITESLEDKIILKKLPGLHVLHIGELTA
jgi:ferredoxin